jgi:phosphoesterase RecJ-like protein
LAYEAAMALGAKLTSNMANVLFMGLAMDTGWFRHANTTAETFRLAEELVRHGAEPTLLHERLFDGVPLARLRLQARALERLTLTANGKIAFTEVLRDDFIQSGAAPGDTEEIINAPRCIQGVEVAILFLEQFDGSTKISFRARNTDVSRIAEQFGGGGHRLAAGGRVKRPLAEVKAEVLAAVESALNAD